MNKIDIYIDFEAISSPFNHALKLHKDFPFAYSLGVIINDEMKTRTFIFDFSRYRVEEVDKVLRNQIINDVRSITNDRSILINSSSARFVSFAPILEKNILRKVYRGVDVIDVSKGAKISLSRATDEFIKKDIYFSNLKKWVSENIDPKFVSKRGLMHDGALAAFAGHLLLASAKDISTKWYKGTGVPKKLLEEIKIYSKDDVVRMFYISKDFTVFKKKDKEWTEAVNKKNKLIKHITTSTRLLNSLEEYDEKTTVKELKKILRKKINELELEKSNHEKN